MSELSKTYEPQSVEDKWYDFWLKQGCFTADPARVTDKRPAYSIVIPPPNVTGILHMGHVLNNTIQDILSRKARMDGKEVLWLPGTDHAGIATQVQVEKALKKEERLTKYDLGREKFLERVWQWKEKHGGIIINQLKKLGASCDWTRERFTMDPEYSRCVQKVFVELYKKGLIYRGKRMVNRSRVQSHEHPSFFSWLMMKPPCFSFHCQTRSRNFSRPRSCFVRRSSFFNAFSTCTCVAMPAWSVPGNQRTSLPSMRALRARMSWMVLLRTCPMWSTPVTYGGGITME